MQLEAEAVLVIDFVEIQLLADDGLDVQFLPQLARQSRSWILSGLDLAAGEFPFQRMPAAALTLADQDFPVPRHYCSHDFHSPCTHGC